MDNTIELENHKPLVTNRYTLVVMAAKRAKQIKEGAPSLIDTESTNCLTIALEEIAAGKINYIEAPETEDDEAIVSTIAAPPRSEQSALQMLAESLDSGERTSSLDDEPESEDETDTESDSDDDSGSSPAEDE